MKILIKTFMAIALLGASILASAGVVVIVNPAAGFASLSEDDVSRIFLGKAKTFPDGSAAVALNQDEGSAVRDKFNDAVCKKSASQYKAYWAQLVFTGKGTPPKDAGDDAAVKKLVAANPNMIGYVDSAAADSSVKVVYTAP